MALPITIGSHLLLFAALVLTLFGNCDQTEVKMVNDNIPAENGGACRYLSHEGKAKIVRITSTMASESQAKVKGGAGYKGFEVWFRFVPKSEIADPEIKALLRGEHLFTLYNGWYVGPRYLKKYKLKPGQSYRCKLKIIQQGACAPVVFEFIALDTKDYFESRP
jgi:hypothetical protein